MAYEKKPGRGVSVPETGGLQTLNSLKKRIKEIVKDSEFYEFEPLEVLEVHLDETKSSFPLKEDQPDYSYIGGVLGRFIYSEQGISVDRCRSFKPLNPNMNSTPVVGEIVIGVKYLSDYYYISSLNLFGNPNLNAQHGVSRLKRKNTLESELGIDTPNEGNDKGTKIGYYIDEGRDTDARKLLPNEGDVIIEGRFGNTIRLGSDVKNENTESPNIILNVGQSKDEFPNTKQPIEEKVDTDGSSIYMTTNQTLEFVGGMETQLVTGPYDGNNILISSDRILFNTKNGGDIGMFSNNNLSLGAKTEVVLESPIVKVGSTGASEPQVLGQILYDKLDALVTAIGGVTGIPTPTGPTPGPIQAAPNWSSVTSAMSAVKDALSSKHRIDE